MEESELRIGGWEKERKRGLFRRLFYLCLVLIVAFLIGGSNLVEYKTAEVSGNSLYYKTGVWNGPFDTKETKEFNGHLKIYSNTYESSDGNSGTLSVVSIRSFLDLETLPISVPNIVVEKVNYHAEQEGLELIGNGFISNEKNEDLPQNTVTFQWTAKIKQNTTSNGFFNGHNSDENIEVRVFYWTKPVTTAEVINFQTIVCIVFGVDQTTINQAIDLVENIR